MNGRARISMTQNKLEISKLFALSERHQLLQQLLTWGWQGGLPFFLQEAFLMLRTSSICSIPCICSSHSLDRIMQWGSLVIVDFDMSFYLVAGETDPTNLTLGWLGYWTSSSYYMRSMKWTAPPLLLGILPLGTHSPLWFLSLGHFDDRYVDDRYVFHVVVLMCTLLLLELWVRFMVHFTAVQTRCAIYSLSHVFVYAAMVFEFHVFWFPLGCA